MHPFQQPQLFDKLSPPFYHAFTQLTEALYDKEEDIEVQYRLRIVIKEVVMSKNDTFEVVVPVHKSMSEILHILGNPELVAISALRRYLVDACLQRIEQAERKIAEYEQIYGLDYATFNHHIGTDETFLETINQKHPTWEADAIEWDYRLEELQTWRARLEKILNESQLSPVPG